jgi:hypothetical protein
MHKKTRRDILWGQIAPKIRLFGYLTAAAKSPHLTMSPEREYRALP